MKIANPTLVISNADELLFWLAVARIALVKPDKAKGVEDVILRGAQYGQITEKVC